MLSLFDDGFRKVLEILSKSYDSSPYFLRAYASLCQKYNSDGNRNALLVGLRRVGTNNCLHTNNNSIVGGYLLGETILSRSSITGDIYFIYVHDNVRGTGNGTILCRMFEEVVKERSLSIGVTVAIIRISLKPCIVNSVSFWNKQGFEGSKSSVFLTKTIKTK